jgi:hypothetical protein
MIFSFTRYFGLAVDNLEKNSTKAKSKTLVTISRRTLLAIVVVAAVATIVTASLLANYIIPTNTVRITAAPGLSAYQTDGVTLVQSINWGDVQEGNSQTYQLSLRNTGGTQTIYILGPSTNTATGVVGTVSSLNPSGLPSGVTLSWNMPTLQGGAGPITCTVNGVTYTGCAALGQGSSTPAITLTLSASATATPTATTVNFVIEFDAFSSPTG